MGRMIYTRLVLDMASGEMLEAQGFEYDGPVTECMGGSGGGSSTSHSQEVTTRNHHNENSPFILNSILRFVCEMRTLAHLPAQV